MNKLILTAACFIYGNAILAQDSISFWGNQIPFELKTSEKEKTTEKGHVYDVQIPKIFSYVPENTKPEFGILICPGGGYTIEAIEKEGHAIAKWFKERGVAAFVLKYRLPDGEDGMSSNRPATDAFGALHYVRSHLRDFGLSDIKLGIMGFSAGGHLAATTAYHTDIPGRLKLFEDHVSPFPDFALLIYPVISMKDSVTHLGSRKKLIGEVPAIEQIEYFSMEEHINEKSIPAFLIHTQDDKAVIVKNSLDLYQSLVENRIQSEIHIFEKGGHGFGLTKPDLPVGVWPELALKWIKSLKK